jgi:hypothetical protein
MHKPLNRRAFIKALAAAPAASILTIPEAAPPRPRRASSSSAAATAAPTAAKYLRVLDKAIEVTLIERETTYTSCPLSNEVISGERDIKTLQVGYKGLQRHGVNVVHDEVTAIDPAKKTVATAGGKSFAYDALILSPGIDFNYGGVEGHSEQLAQTKLPHAWKAGPQTLAAEEAVGGHARWRHLHHRRAQGAVPLPARPLRACRASRHVLQAPRQGQVEGLDPGRQRLVFQEAALRAGLEGTLRLRPGGDDRVGARCLGRYGEARRRREDDVLQRLRRVQGRRHQHHSGAPCRQGGEEPGPGHLQEPSGAR